MVNCPRCGTGFSAEAAEHMTSMGIVALADCPKCRHEFLPLAGPRETAKNTPQQVKPIHLENSGDWWKDDT